MSARLRSLVLPLGLVAAAGCSLICTFNGLQQPCDALGDCLPGYECVGGVCQPGGEVGDGGTEDAGGGDGGGSSSGCAGDTTCPGGACVGGACSDVPTAWQNGTAEIASLAACFPWPPQPAAGNPDVELSGCIVTVPGDPGTGLADAGATVTVLEANNVTIVPATAVLANSKCTSGVGYKVSVPPGQLLDVVVSAPGWATTDNQAVELPAAATSGDRDLGVVSVDGWSQKLTLVGHTLGQSPTAQNALEIGTVRDCNGNSLSGISLQASQVADGGFGVVYLDATGTPVAGRTATDSSGLFAAIALPGTYTLTFAGSAGVLTSSFAVVVTAGGSGWIDLAPQGP